MSVELARARARARMTKSGTIAPATRLTEVRVRFTNPLNLEILAPLTMHQMALHLRALMKPGFDTKEILGRLERAGYEVFLPGVDDEKYRRVVERSRQSPRPKPPRWRRPRVEIR